jgi:hypothetical protein
LVIPDKVKVQFGVAEQSHSPGTQGALLELDAAALDALDALDEVQLVVIIKVLGQLLQSLENEVKVIKKEPQQSEFETL